MHARRAAPSKGPLSSEPRSCTEWLCSTPSNTYLWDLLPIPRTSCNPLLGTGLASRQPATCSAGEGKGTLQARSSGCGIYMWYIVLYPCAKYMGMGLDPTPLPFSVEVLLPGCARWVRGKNLGRLNYISNLEPPVWNKYCRRNVRTPTFHFSTQQNRRKEGNRGVKEGEKKRKKKLKKE